jgi:hypothetical protein
MDVKATAHYLMEYVFPRPKFLKYNFAIELMNLDATNVLMVID